VRLDHLLSKEYVSRTLVSIRLTRSETLPVGALVGSVDKRSGLRACTSSLLESQDFIFSSVLREFPSAPAWPIHLSSSARGGRWPAAAACPVIAASTRWMRMVPTLCVAL